MGCSKNLVDSEQLMHRLSECGYEVTHDCEMPEGEIAVINTCGFIGDAKEVEIVSGHCQGVDMLGETYAEGHDIPVMEIPYAPNKKK